MAQPTRNKRWQGRNRIRVVFIIIVSSVLWMIVMSLLWIMFRSLYGENSREFFSKIRRTGTVAQPEIKEMFLTPNPYSRPGTPLVTVRGVVVHYTANPGAEAEQNRDYFESMKTKKTKLVSSHFIIGIDGTIVQCIPLNEISYASNQRNVDTISIECCHKNKTGIFTEDTYNSLIKLTAWLCSKYNLKERNIIRHYDVTGKLCPLYYVKHEDKWKQFRKEVFYYIEEHKPEGTE